MFCNRQRCHSTIGYPLVPGTVLQCHCIGNNLATSTIALNQMSKLVDLNNLTCSKCGESGVIAGKPCSACGYQGLQLRSSPAIALKEPQQITAFDIDDSFSKSIDAAITQASEEHRLQEEFDRNWPTAVRLLRTAASDAAWEKAGLDRPWWEFKYKTMGMEDFWGPLPPRDSDK